MAGLIQKSARRFTTQIGAAGVADAVVTTIPLVSVTGLPTDTPIELIIDRSDSSGVLTPSKEEVVRGTISGTNLINCTRGVEGTAQAHSAGATVNALLTASMWNNMSQYIRDMPSRGLIGGIIQPTVASNNLTVAIKTLAGNDPSANDPVYVWIGNTLRPITSALSVTANAGTNYLNMGSAELAGREVDLFLYIGLVGSDLKLTAARIPYARTAADLSSFGINEKGDLGNNLSPYNTTVPVVNVGRFAATLSASASFNWSVPTFTNVNLIQEPVYETRWLTYQPTYTASASMTWTGVTTTRSIYKISMNQDVKLQISALGTTGGTASNELRITLPIYPTTFNEQRVGGTVIDNVGLNGQCLFNSTDMRCSRYDSANFGLGANRGIYTKTEYRLD